MFIWPQIEDISPNFWYFMLKVIYVPERDPDGPRGKWFVTEEEYPRDDYPPYCSGTVYLTTIDTMKIILPAVKKLPFNFIDDLLGPML